MGLHVTSLSSRGNALAPAEAQVRHLESTAAVPAFERQLAAAGLPPLVATGIEVLQLNVGKLCNQACRHCHVDAGPDRREQMTHETARACMRALAASDIPVVDITGGAPELNPNFRWLVEESRRLGRQVLDRSNLTVLLLPSQADLGAFLAEHRVEVVASLPSVGAAQTDAQRGDGIFDRSIEALRALNALGYGSEGTGLTLNLVTNPVGAFLPGSQASLEAHFKTKLAREHGVVFNRLYTLTNMPISRFLEYLIESGNYDRYMERLVAAFNPRAVDGLMCRTTLSVGWDGTLYDCDFNQMLELAVGPRSARSIHEFDPAALARRRVVTGKHCFGCTAGAGSSCGGVTV